MEIRVLRYFLTVVREESVTKAADVLHITQPTLSRQRSQLEEETGTEKERLYCETRNLREAVFETEAIKRCTEQVIEPREQTRGKNILL